MRAIFLILGMASPIFAEAPAAPDFFQQAKQTEESIRGAVNQWSVSLPSGDYVEEGLVLADPAAEGIDAAALRRLMDRAEAERSDAVLILRNGKLIAAQGALDRKVDAMSATKSVIGLAVGMLLDEGRIGSLDQPVSDFYPQWRAGEKNKITVGMLLNHTSGLERLNRILAWDGSIDGSLPVPLDFPPGTAFRYNNNAVDLLAGLIEKVSGERADLYINKRLFEPLAITDWAWEKYTWQGVWSSDRASAGLPGGAGGLYLRPLDLAKIGQMVLDGGVWKGRRIVNSAWIERSAAPSQSFEPEYGLLWWLDGAEGFSGRGSFGQFVVIDLKRRLVGVRMRAQRPDDLENARRSPPRVADCFDDFPDMVHRLAAQRLGERSN